MSSFAGCARKSRPIAVYLLRDARESIDDVNALKMAVSENTQEMVGKGSTLFNQSASFPPHVKNLYFAQMTLTTQPNDDVCSFSVLKRLSSTPLRRKL